MRNLADYELGFREMARAVRPGGRVVCLEIARPTQPARPAHRRAGSTTSCPLIGRLVGQGSAYAYLVRSTRDYPARTEMADIMRAARPRATSTWFGMSGGIVTIHAGSVPDADAA